MTLLHQPMEVLWAALHAALGADAPLGRPGPQYFHLKTSPRGGSRGAGWRLDDGRIVFLLSPFLTLSWTDRHLAPGRIQRPALYRFDGQPLRPDAARKARGQDGREPDYHLWALTVGDAWAYVPDVLRERIGAAWMGPTKISLQLDTGTTISGRDDVVLLLTPNENTE